ncbi:MAG TPA: transglutaminase domain-containing protein, partial [Steroidobacteraceae bacterium]
PGGWLRYEARYSDRDGWYAPPAPEDLSVPASERKVLEQVARTLALEAAAPAQAVERLRQHFDRFTYSTWRDQDVPAGMTAMEDFLLHSKTGHCEYFAAATTLLLRAAGIPARYATGYAVIEYSPLEEAWIVRARHAHAWSRAYINGRWTDVDLTPASWPEAEAGLRPSWERLEDIVRWLVFRLTEGGENERSGAIALVALMLAALVGWRFLRKRKASRPRTAAAEPQRPGEDSEFYQVERSLAARFPARSPHESLEQWCSGIEARLSLDMRSALRQLLELHYRYRFDPLGLDREARQALRARASVFQAELQRVSP